jgi:hypothetical protein
MTDNLDDQLRAALRPIDPGEKFTQGVMSQITSDMARSRRSMPRRARWLSAGLVVSVVLSVLVIHEWQARRQRQGLQARRQLIEALQVTGAKLDLAYRVVNDSAAGDRPGT